MEETSILFSQQESRTKSRVFFLSTFSGAEQRNERTYFTLLRELKSGLIDVPIFASGVSQKKVLDSKYNTFGKLLSILSIDSKSSHLMSKVFKSML